MTTTSEIAAAVREGHADVLELWAAVRRFAHDRAFRWCRALEGRGGCTLDDLMQLEDVVEDPAAEEEFCVVEELDRREAIRRALSHLTADQRTAVVLRHCRGLTLDQTAARMHTTRTQARAAEQKGLRALRHPSRSKELREYL